MKAQGRKTRKNDLMTSLIQEKVNSVECKQKRTLIVDDGENSRIFKCGDCHETFETLFAKKRHEKFFHFFSKPFICECGQKFGKLCEINYHIRRVHEQERNYVCGVCKKSFFKNSDLVIHQSVHDTAAKFICEDCGRKFKHVSNLNRHTRTHTGVKPYLCLPCNKRFSQIAALRQHETTEKHRVKAAGENAKKQESTLVDNNQTENAASGANGAIGATGTTGATGATGATGTYGAYGAIGAYDPDDPSDLNYANGTPENDMNPKTNTSKRKWWFYCKICGERFPFSVLLRDHETKHMTNKDIRCNSCKMEFLCMKDFINHSCSRKLESQQKSVENTEVPDETVKTPEIENMNDDSYLLDGKGETFIDKRVELTLAQNGQIMLDNDEVLLTLNDRVYGLVLVNNDVTVVDNDDYMQLLNKSHDLFDENPDFPEIDNDFNMENFQSEMNENEVDGVERLVLSENWLWSNEDYGDGKFDEGLMFDEAKNEEKQIPDGILPLPDEDTEKRENDSENTTTVKRKFKCPECGKEFSWNSSLRNHLITKHAKQIEFSCVKCNKTYYSRLLVEEYRNILNFQHHIKRDHLNIRAYKCTFCGKSFFRRYDLKVHVRIHTDERPYICKVCGRRFRHLSHSIRHDRTHLKESQPQEKEIDFFTN